MGKFLNEFKQFAMRGKMPLPFQGDLLYFAFYPRRSYLICSAVLRFHLFSDAIAWQNAAYPGVPCRIPAESALV